MRLWESERSSVYTYTVSREWWLKVCTIAFALQHVSSLFEKWPMDGSAFQKNGRLLLDLSCAVLVRYLQIRQRPCCTQRLSVVCGWSKRVIQDIRIKLHE